MLTEVQKKLLLFGLALALWSLALTTAQAQDPARAPSKAPAFPHRPHLAADFASPGREKDCRTCHTFKSKGFDAYKEPYKTCTECHQDSAHVSFPKPAFGKRGKNRPFFDHNQHKATSCVECHEPQLSRGSGTSDLTFDVSRSLESCQQCHADHDPARPIMSETGRGESCNQCHLRKKLRPVQRTDRAFSHKNHFDPKTATAKDCLTCHAGIRKSTRVSDDLHHFAAGDCKQCHNDGDGKQAGLKLEKVARPPTRFDRFDHSVHITKVGQGGAGAVSCTPCHTFDGAGELKADYTNGYESCVQCHTEWKVDNHGAGIACWRCHVRDEDFSTGKMAVAKVTRWRPGSFSFGEAAHPEVTRAGAKIEDADCAACHRAKPSTLDRRAFRKFTHRSHVPGDASGEDCAKCHASILQSGHSAATTSYEDTDRAGGKSCVSCHKGGHTKDRGKKTTVVVAEFDHAAHMRSDQIKNCAVCHETGRDGTLAVPGPESCKKCHNHGTDKGKQDYSARTGKLGTPRELKSCARCHGKDINTRSSRKPMFRVHATIVSGQQFHDKTGACSACHGFEVPPTTRIVPFLESVRHKSIHRDQAFRDAPFNRPESEGNSCASCHRKRPRSLPSGGR